MFIVSGNILNIFRNRFFKLYISFIYTQIYITITNADTAINSQLSSFCDYGVIIRM